MTEFKEMKSGKTERIVELDKYVHDYFQKIGCKKGWHKDNTIYSREYESG